MVKVKEDLTGKVFGRLTVISQTDDHICPSGKHFAMWNCKCSCGNPNIIKINGESLKHGHTISCGCYKYELCKKYNEYNLTGEYGVGWTSNTNSEFYFDLEDYEKIKNYCWFEYIDNHNYHSLKAYDRLLHTVIGFATVLGCKNYDHKNRNALDNRKNNLRLATTTENARNRSKRSNNTSGIIGVSWCSRDCVWKASIGVDKHEITLGTFCNKEDAIKARLNAEAKYFGEFAPQRDLFEQYGIKYEGSDSNET